MRTSSFIAAALAAAAIFPSGAVAATTLGSALATEGSKESCFAGEACTIVQTALPGREVIAPADGVVTRWSVRNADGILALKVVRDRVPGMAAVAVSDPATATAGTVTTAPTRLPIAAGDRIALDVPAGSRIGLSYRLGATLERFATLGGTPEAPQYLGPDDYEVLYNAVVERDDDRDGFGDETQDGCPADPQLQEQCPPADVPSDPAPGSEPESDPAPFLDAGAEGPYLADPPGVLEPAPLGEPGVVRDARRVLLLTRVARLRRARRLVVLVGCEAAEGEHCEGALTLRLPGGPQLGRAQLRIAAGASRAIAVRVTAPARRRLRGRRVVIGVAMDGRRRILGAVPIR